MNTVQDINFTPKVRRALDVARQRCVENNQEEITDEFLLHAVLFSENMIVNMVFQSLSIETKDVILALSKILPSSKKKISAKNIIYSASSSLIINESHNISQSFKQNYTGIEHIFLSLLRNSKTVTRFFKKNGVDVGFISQKVETECRMLSNPVKKPLQQKEQSEQNNVLSAFCSDYNQMALNESFDNIFFREKEVAKMSEVLCRKQKKNAILIGEPGVGKSAIVGLLAKKIISCECTEFLINKKIISLNLANLIAGTKLRGEFEERLVKTMNEIKKMGNVIVFIDEVHNVIGMGNDAGSMDAANILKQYLTTDEISFVAATTQSEYENYFVKDSAMNRRFEPIFVSEPSKEETFKILKSLKKFYEKFHMVYYSDNVITDIVNLCEKYIPSRKFPDKAIDLMDQVGSKVKIRSFSRPQEIKDIEKLIVEFEKLAPDNLKENHLKLLIKDYELKYDIWTSSVKGKIFKAKTKDVYQALSDKIGKFIDSKSDNDGIKNILSNLKKYVFGQDEALKKISDCVLRSSFGLAKVTKPLGSFMFVGPTGSGKTHAARTLAKQAFGDEANLCVVDMSEFMEQHSVSKLIGSPPGYIGYGGANLFWSHLDKHPSSVFLFDEIEKAHPDVVNILLQIMDSGQLTDSMGRKLSFKNSIIIMTGNVGFQANDNKKIGFGASVNQKPSKETVTDNLKKFFRPEFLARLNDIIIFDELQQDSLIKIAQSELNQIKDSLKQNQTILTYSSDVVDFIINNTKNSNTGARKIIFFIENELKSKIVDILSLNNYNKINVSVKNGQIYIDGKVKKLFATCKK
ncbi:MAG: ATP-dependent Clp protease ATP-binding subunit [Bacteroidetes bacterium]|nr:ATP-dependent Clp protease ATP-binding subunit [Bacteroidota bacterium]